MDVIDYIYDECHRQHVTNYGDFAWSWAYAKKTKLREDSLNFGLFVKCIALGVEPEKNAMPRLTTNLRTSHVGFMDGGSAAPAGEVKERFERWCTLTFPLLHPLVNLSGGEIDFIIKQLLDIHPWVDGNGRTASILRNWMQGTLDDPQPLPYYYGKS